MSKIITQSDYTSALVSQRNDLADNIDTKGVEAEQTEKLNALVPKVLEIETGGGGSVELSYIGDVPLEAFSGDITYRRFWKWSYVQETNDNAKTSSTLTPNVGENALMIVACMHRDSAVSIDGDDWTLVTTTPAINLNQQITVWKKTVTPGTYTVTTSQSSSVRMSLKVIVIPGGSDVSVTESIDASNPVTASSPTGHPRLYLLSKAYAINEDSSVTWSCTENLKSATEKRFAAYFDNDSQSTRTPTFSDTNDNSNYNYVELDLE